MTVTAIRVMIVDDQEMIRAGLRTILDRDDRVEVVADAGDGQQAVRMLDTVDVDVILMESA